MSSCSGPLATTPSILFALAIVLSAISYVAGVVLSAVPGVSKRMRKLGSTMMLDGAQSVFVLVLLAVPGAVMNLLSQVGFGSVQAAYDALFTWVGISCGQISPGPSVLQNVFSALIGFVTVLILLYAAQFAIQNLLSYVVLAAGLVSASASGAVQALTLVLSGAFGVWASYYLLGYAPILTLAPAVLFMIVGTYYLGQFVLSYWAAMMAAGAVIFALPLGVGRKWGAALMAASLVLYLGLPLMPVFVGTLSTPQAAANAINAAEQNNPAASQYLIQTRPANVYFTVSTLGPQPTDYFQLSLKQLSGDYPGDEWFIWTDQNGMVSYALPSGSYNVTSVKYLGIPVQFTASPSGVFSVEESGASAWTAPPEIATVSVQLQVYSFTLRMIEAQRENVSFVQEPFFLDLQYWSGGSVSFPPASSALNSANMTVCPTAQNITGHIYIPNPRQTKVFVIYANAPVTLTPTGISANLGPSADGTEYQFLVRAAEGSQGVPGCQTLSLSANLVQFGSYPMQNQDPTATFGTSTSPSGAQQALTSQFDQLTNIYISYLVVPLLYVGLVLPGVAAGLASLVMRRWA